MLQLWWLPNTVSNLEEQLAKLNRDETVDGVETRDDVVLPFPTMMLDADLALGPGFGLAYNTFAFLCHRLWLKFYIGAGGGLAFSACIVHFIEGSQ